MSVPGIVQSTLEDEDIAARVSLGGEDELFITPSRTLVYRAEGLLSDESVDDFAHDADRLTLSEGRRKTKFSLEYALEGTQKFTIPSSKTDDVLHPVLAGVLNGNDITDPGETVVQTYRFSELTLIITSDRLVKHIGSAVWDDDYEEYHFADVTNLSFEDGSVATQIVLAVDGRPQRIKAPNEEANDLRERLKRALFEYHEVDSLAALNELVDEETDAEPDDDASMDFGDGVDPLDADPPEPDDLESDETTGDASDSTSSEAVAGAATASQSTETAPRDDGGGTTQSQRQAPRQSGTELETGSQRDEPSAATVETGDLFDDTVSDDQQEADSSPPVVDATDSALLERIDNLEDAIDHQSELIERQQQTIEQLIAELRQGR